MGVTSPYQAGQVMYYQPQPVQNMVNQNPNPIPIQPVPQQKAKPKPEITLQKNYSILIPTFSKELKI